MTASESTTRLNLTVVIVSYNSGRVIVDKLKPVVGSGRWRTLVVDNNSNDDSAELLQDNFAADQIIALASNIGYGRAANVAFERMKTRFALLLNPDIEVSEAEVLDFFIAAEPLFERAVIVAPATSEKDFLQQGASPRKNVLGAAMLFDMAQLEEVGTFDENLFLFYEEQDLCRRAVGAGKQILLSTDHYFPHAKGTSSGGSDRIYYLKQWHVGWSSCYFFRKHGLDRGRKRPPVLLLRYILKSVLSFSARKRLKYRARVAGVLSYLTGKRPFDEEDNPRGLTR